MTGDSDTDRRNTGRTEIFLKVQYDDPGAMLADYLTDLSRGGLFICTPVPFEIGHKLDFTISFPGLLDPLDLSGVVRWRNDGSTGSGKPIGVGVEFDFADEEQKGEIMLFIDRCRHLHNQAQAGTDERPFRVLLIEDNSFTHDLFSHAVKRFYRELGRTGGLEIVSAFNGQEALERMDTDNIDLAIVDYFLPVMNGADIIRTMRRDPRFAETPIVMISAGGDGVQEIALEAGADLYVVKPVMLKQLLNTLHALISGRATTSP